MRNFLVLTKVQFSALFKNKKNSPLKNKLGGVAGFSGMLLLYAALIIYVGAVYSNMFADMLKMSGQLDRLLPLMLAMGALISFFFSFYTTTGALYGFKDYDFLSALPIKTNVIIASKLTFMYLSSLCFVLLIMIPSVVVASNYGAIPNLYGIISLLVMTILSPGLPVAISVVLGGLVALISSRFKRKNLVQIILWLLLLIGSFALSFLSGINSQNASSNPFMSIMKIYFLMDTVALAVTNPTYLILFVAENLLPLVVISCIVALTYAKMHTLLTARKKTKNYKFKTSKVLGAQKALFNREIKQFFSIPTYVINCLFGGIFSIIGLIAVAIVLNMLSGQTGINFAETLVLYLPLGLSFANMTAPSTACSISLEGETFWVIRTSPVRFIDLFNVKIAVNLVFSVLPAVVGVIAFAIITRINLISSVLLALYALFIPLLASNVGLLVNVLFPMMKWDNPIKPVKQGVSVLISMLAGLVYTGLQFSIVYFIPLPVNALIGICLAFTVVLSIASYLLVYFKGEEWLIKKLG